MVTFIQSFDRTGADNSRALEHRSCEWRIAGSSSRLV